MLQAGCPNRGKKRVKSWTGRGQSQLQAYKAVWGPHEGVEDKIMNMGGPDKETTTLCSARLRVEATARRNSLKKHP